MQPKYVQRDYLMVAAVQLPRTIAETREDLDADDMMDNNTLYAQAQVISVYVICVYVCVRRCVWRKERDWVCV